MTPLRIVETRRSRVSSIYISILIKTMYNRETIITHLKDILEELLDSSTSSTSDEENVALLQYQEPRIRVSTFVESTIAAYTEEEFKNSFRMSRQTADYLIERYAHSGYYRPRSYQGGRAQSTAETEMFDESQKLFNDKFQQTFGKIENAFALLKTRFQQLVRLVFQNVETMDKFILACCALHNVYLDRNDQCVVAPKSTH